MEFIAVGVFFAIIIVIVLYIIYQHMTWSDPLTKLMM